jgi:hypothetical protein
MRYSNPEAGNLLRQILKVLRLARPGEWPTAKEKMVSAGKNTPAQKEAGLRRERYDGEAIAAISAQRLMR